MESKCLKFEKMASMSGIFGVICVKNVKFLILISKAEKVATLMHKEIYKISSLEFVRINSDLINIDNEVVSMMERINKYLTMGFYFSYDYDLS